MSDAEKIVNIIGTLSVIYLLCIIITYIIVDIIAKSKNDYSLITAKRTDRLTIKFGTILFIVFFCVMSVKIG